MKVVVLKCPQCGAHLESNRTLCEHCGTTVRLSEDKQNFIGIGITCPKCNANNLAEDRHCGSCGEKLVTNCPIPNCHEENNIWRKFCRKCGRDINGTYVEMLEGAQKKYKEEMQQYLDEIDRIEKILPDSKSRETTVKVLIWAAGGLISLAFLASGGGELIGTIITLIIAGVIASNYRSSEDYNLLCLLETQKNDLERTMENYNLNEENLKRIKSS